MSEEDLKKFDALTDADIERAAQGDVDWQGIDLADNMGWRVVYPDGSVVVPLVLDARINSFITEHHIDYQAFLSGVLKAYVESQQKSGV